MNKGKRREIQRTEARTWPAAYDLLTGLPYVTNEIFFQTTTPSIGLKPERFIFAVAPDQKLAFAELTV